jgi:hypothetical protein
VYAAEEPIVFVRAELLYPAIVPISSKLVNGVLPPRFDAAAGVLVEICDSDDAVLSSYLRADPRLSYLEGGGPFPSVDGTPILFNASVVDGMRKIRVMDTVDSMVMEADLGPVLVGGCESGDIPPETCATFDSDGDGCKDLDDPEPLIPETEPPVLSVEIQPTELWPPNHKLRKIQAVVEVTDNCDTDPVVVLESITSNEPDNGTGDGDHPNDIQNAGIGSLSLAYELRAERSGKGSGRIYTVTYQATDRAGNVALESMEVSVPARGGKK